VLRVSQLLGIRTTVERESNPSKGTVTMKKLAPFMILVIIAAAAYALINRDSSDAV